MTVRRKCTNTWANSKKSSSWNCHNPKKAEVLDLWKAEILRFKEYLEEKFEVTITDEQVREAVKLENKVRASLKNLYGVMRHDPAPIKGHDLFRVLYGSGF